MEVVCLKYLLCIFLCSNSFSPLLANFTKSTQTIPLTTSKIQVEKVGLYTCVLEVFFPLVVVNLASSFRNCVVTWMCLFHDRLEISVKRINYLRKALYTISSSRVRAYFFGF
jgi:hypothetical protein